MPLSCGCDHYYGHEYGVWLYDAVTWPMDFETLSAGRAKRCVSCNKLIKVGDICLSHPRSRYAYDEIEARITGSDPEAGEPTIRMADHLQCERCGEIWLNLFAVGYECLGPSENMEEALKEYHELTGFKKTS